MDNIMLTIGNVIIDESNNKKYRVVSIVLEEFRQRVKDLVGDEYEVIEQVADDSIGEKRVKIKHNKCGEEKIYLVKKFLSGSRCPKCRTHISKERINIMLDECSNGRYEMVVCDGYKNKLIDKTTNK